jgi:hypothetical protein
MPEKFCPILSKPRTGLAVAGILEWMSCRGSDCLAFQDAPEYGGNYFKCTVLNKIIDIKEVADD